MEGNYKPIIGLYVFKTTLVNFVGKHFISICLSTISHSFVELKQNSNSLHRKNAMSGMHGKNPFASCIMAFMFVLDSSKFTQMNNQEGTLLVWRRSDQHLHLPSPMRLSLFTAMQPSILVNHL